MIKQGNAGRAHWQAMPSHWTLSARCTPSGPQTIGLANRDNTHCLTKRAFQSRQGSEPKFDRGTAALPACEVGRRHVRDLYELRPEILRTRFPWRFRGPESPPLALKALLRDSFEKSAKAQWAKSRRRFTPRFFTDCLCRKHAELINRYPQQDSWHSSVRHRNAL